MMMMMMMMMMMIIIITSHFTYRIDCVVILLLIPHISLVQVILYQRSNKTKEKQHFYLAYAKTPIVP